MSHDFQVGDIVDITIRGARVVEPSPTARPGRLPVVISDGSRGGIPYLLPEVEVTRVVPAEWPPQPGDLWRDKHGELWFIHRRPFDSDAKTYQGRTTGGARWIEDAAELIKDNAPLTLVHREES